MDPNLHEFLVDRAGLDLGGVTKLFNERAGFSAFRESNDMRTLARGARARRRAGCSRDRRFPYRLAKAVLGLSAALERIDALVFTGGIGEHAAPVRAETLESLRVLGPCSNRS